MRIITRALRMSGAATFVALATWSCGTDSDPVQLAYRLDASPGTSFVTSLTHNLAFHLGDHGSEGVREIRLGYTVRGERAGQASGAVTLDSVRASMVWGRMQQRVDARHLVGRGFGITIANGDDGPAYDADVPAIDMGDRGGGEVPASFLVAYAYPALPDEPVAPGSTWSEQTTGPWLEGVLWVKADVGTTHRVIGMERVEGESCLRIESESTGTLSGGSTGDTPLDYSGRLNGTASWCFDVESGVLLEMTGETTTTGSTPWPNGATADIDQTSRVEVRAVNGGAS